MKIEFKAMEKEDVPLYLEWAKLPHVKEIWFYGDYEPPEYIHVKIEGNGYDYPHIILLDGQPIGYIVSCDLYAYKTLCEKPTGLFIDEESGTYCMDLFIAEESLLNKGFGTQIVQKFSDKLLADKAEKILIDPSADNKRAIRCYEKAGFTPVRTAHDGTTECLILEKC